MLEKTRAMLEGFKHTLESDVRTAKKFHDRKAEWLATSYLEQFNELLKNIIE